MYNQTYIAKVKEQQIVLIMEFHIQKLHVVQTQMYTF